MKYFKYGQLTLLYEYFTLQYKLSSRLLFSDLNNKQEFLSYITGFYEKSNSK